MFSCMLAFYIHQIHLWISSSFPYSVDTLMVQIRLTYGDDYLLMVLIVYLWCRLSTYDVNYLLMVQTILAMVVMSTSDAN
jgi:hypothetical protein